MSPFELVSVVLAGFATVVVPLVLFVIRGTIKWTRVEDKLDHAIGRLDTIVRDKDQTHAEMIHQMTEDRKATDQRLRWLEENVWRNLRTTNRRDNT